MTANGILCESGGKRVMLDPRSADPSAINFVSHAHADHLPSGGSGQVLCSGETGEIAALRGARIARSQDHADGLEMVDSGHILGSRGLLFDEIFYTGDICTRGRGFLRGARVPRCRVLITESTFGAPGYDFPGIDETRKRVDSLVSGLYSRGVPVILMGYQLGKAQTITQLFGHWTPLYLHDSVLAMNELHGRLGVRLPSGTGHTEAQKAGLLDKRPWVMVAPMMQARSGFIREMKSKYGAVTVAFTGWAASARAPFGRGADYSVPLSDHCDFGELVDVARRTGADDIYTTHGFAAELASHLEGLGMRAQPLVPRTRTRRTGSPRRGTSRSS